MKRLVTVFFGLMLIASFAQADLNMGQGGDIATIGEITSRAPISITQNGDTSYLTSASVACGGGTTTTQNWYLRRFPLADYGIANQLTVADIDLGVSWFSEDVPGTGYTFDLVLFTIANGDPFLFGNMTEIARVTSAPVALTDGVPYFLNMAIAGTVYAGDDLVVAIDAPDGSSPVGAQFRPGANDAAYTAPSYLAAEACGLTEPLDVDSIGFPDSQLVLIVNGDADGTTATDDATFSSIKSLY